MKSNDLWEGVGMFVADQPPPGMDRAVAAALIGPEGGVIQVADPDSPINGITLKIPTGALDRHQLIQIEAGEHDCRFGLIPSVKISPEGLRFNQPAELDMRFSRRMLESDDLQPALFVYDHAQNDWQEKDDGTIEQESGVAHCQIWQL
jgi:hypothetical protein